MSLIRPRLRPLFALLALTLLASACGSDPDVASVDGGDTLTQVDVEGLLGAASVGDASLDGLDVAALADMPNAGTIDKVQAADVISAWIINELWFSALAEGGFTDVQSYLDTARSELEQIALSNPNVPDLSTPFGAEIVRSNALAPMVTAYMLDVEGVVVQWPVQLCSSHILLDTEEEALAAIARLDAGEDFAALAAELSTGPSGPSGGALGCVDPASFVPEFVDGAAALGGPGITPPVQTDFGFHVIDVQSFGPTPSEDPVEIQSAVLSSAEFIAFQDEVIARDVTVDPRFGVWDVDTFSVIPAAG